MELPSQVKRVAVGFMAVLWCLYVAGYFGRTEIYAGEFQGSIITFRLFDHELERKVWTPLLAVEGAIRHGEFYGHTKNGASLPPPAEVGER